jgi:hypothetical protein
MLATATIQRLSLPHCIRVFSQSRHLRWLALVFLLRYTRVIASSIGNYKYRPTPTPRTPSYRVTDVTVVICTTDIMSETFVKVVQSILKHSIAKLIISTAGPKIKAQSEAFEMLLADPRIVMLHREQASRREQTAQAMEHVDTSLLVLQDDHTYWPVQSSFTKSVLAPFEEPETGAVGVVLKARHRKHPFSFAGFWNFLGMTYLARRHYEYCGTYGVDGGISTLAGRFSVFRSEIYKSEEFLQAYRNEYVFFGKVGPLNADDDKFHTRWLIDHGWKIRLQAGPESVMTTELGEWPKFNEQVLRWMRTTWRSNPRQLLHYKSWAVYPYTTWTLMNWFFRLSLVQEPLMLWLLRATLKEVGKLKDFKTGAIILYTWIVGMKSIKIMPHVKKNPKDLMYLPAYLGYGYWATLVKVWALLTCWNASWATAKVSDKISDTDKKNTCATRSVNGKPTITVLENFNALDNHAWKQFGRAAANCSCGLQEQ